jgi:hypothetical protein
MRVDVSMNEKKKKKIENETHRCELRKMKIFIALRQHHVEPQQGKQNKIKRELFF